MNLNESLLIHGLTSQLFECHYEEEGLISCYFSPTNITGLIFPKHLLKCIALQMS
jgi:hypothetical protein